MKKTVKFIFFVALVLNVQFLAHSQDGEALFKQCNVCHLLGKNSTGPNLKGVKQKWIDGGEQENLYAWVKNSTELIASGKSKLAKDIEGFSASAMSNQNLSNEEIDAVLDYVDNYVEAAPVVDNGPTGTTADAPIVYKANYEKNLTLFYWLLVTTVLLLIAILVISGSTKTFIRSDYFKKRMIELNQNGNKTMLLAVLFTAGFSLISTNSFGLTFNGPGVAEEGQTWLLVEDIDLYMLVIVNLILLGVVFYLKGLFNQMLTMIQSPKELEAAKAAPPVTAKINKVLTGAVAIEDEHTILMNHEYDGIQELDNNLPTWWVWGFYATIIFAIVYVFNYHILGTSDLQLEEYNKEMVSEQKKVDAYLSKMAMNVDETNAVLLTEEKDLSAGQAIFEANCIACHLKDGSGQIGPNLTDKNWIYGFDVKDVFSSVKLGRPKGMPEHASKLNPIQIQQVSSFVLSMPEKKGTLPAQGEIIEGGSKDATAKDSTVVAKK